MKNKVNIHLWLTSDIYVNIITKQLQGRRQTIIQITACYGDDWNTIVSY